MDDQERTEEVEDLTEDMFVEVSGGIGTILDPNG
jgi:hypothetical protein